MKSFRKLAVVIATVLALTMPMTALAADGDLLLNVDYTSEKFETVNVTDDSDVQFADRFDLVLKKNYLGFSEKADDPAPETHLWYMYETKYEITADTQYTYYFEAASPVAGKYDGIALATNGENHIMLYGAFSMNGDAGTNDYRIRINNKDTMLPKGRWFDQLGSAYTVADENGVNFTTMKVEFDGLVGSMYTLDENGEWVAVNNIAGTPAKFNVPEGYKIAVGVYGRNGDRPLIVKNTKLLSGIDLSVDQVPKTGDATANVATGLMVVGIMAAAAYILMEKKYRMN